MKQTNLSTEQARNTGLAIAILLTITALVQDARQLLIPLVLLLFCTLFFPQLLHAILVPLYLAATRLIGPFLGKTLLIICFYNIILPVGKVRSFFDHDALEIHKIRRGEKSAFHTINHSVTSDDIRDPY